MKRHITFVLALATGMVVQAQTDTLKTGSHASQHREGTLFSYTCNVQTAGSHASQPVNLGFGIEQTLGESTMSVALSNDINRRSSKNIGTSLYGQVLGLTTLQGTGDYASFEPTFFVRGLQSLNGSSPLIMVDGIERNITNISPEEVERVIVLKDAPATALYGYKGANGAINIITKRGRYNFSEIKFT